MVKGKFGQTSKSLKILRPWLGIGKQNKNKLITSWEWNARAKDLNNDELCFS